MPGSLNRIVSLAFRSPRYPDDPEKTRSSRAVNFLVQYLNLVLALALVANVFVFEAKTLNYPIIFGLLAVAAGLRLAILAGRPRLAAIVYVVVIWAAISAIVAVSGGMRSADVYIQLALVVVAAILLDLRFAVAVAAATVAFDGGLAVLEQAGLAPPQLMAQPTYAKLIFLVFALLIVIAPVYIVLGDLRKALAAAAAGQKKYAGLFERAPVMYAVLRSDAEGQLRIADCNLAFASALGRPKEALAGARLADCYDEASAKLLAENYSSPDSLAALAPTERTLMTADGRRLETLATAVPDYDADGRTVGMLLMFLDVTDLKAVESDRGRLLAEREVLLHELHHRTLNNMQLMCSLIGLYEDEAGGERTAMYRSVRHRIETMAIAQRQLYDSGDLTAIDLAAYTRELVAYCLSSYPAGRLPPAIIFDLESLAAPAGVALPFGLVMMELVSNALLHGAGAAGAAGRIDIVLKRRPDGAVAVSVADSGDGLPAGFQAGRDGGVGLRNALAMAEQQLSGRLDFSSESGLRADLVFAVAAAPTAQNRRAGFPRRRPIA